MRGYVLALCLAFGGCTDTREDEPNSCLAATRQGTLPYQITDDELDLGDGLRYQRVADGEGDLPIFAVWRRTRLDGEVTVDELVTVFPNGLRVQTDCSLGEERVSVRASSDATVDASTIEVAMTRSQLIRF
jgi:hypothetical protein